VTFNDQVAFNLKLGLKVVKTESLRYIMLAWRDRKSNKVRPPSQEDAKSHFSRATRDRGG